MKSGRLTKSVLKAGASFAALSIALALSGNASAGALPNHGHFVSGQGSIGKGNQSVTVKQSTTTGIIDWNSFSIGSKGSVSFNNGTGATLNRVTGGNLSKIAGSLHATGSLYLMNNAGVIVSGTGRVVTGGNFAVSTGNIGSAAFDPDRRFKAGNIVNKGSIVAGGSASLIGRNVSDSGSIHASAVNLAAARDLSVRGAITAQKANGTGGVVTARARTIVISTDGAIDASGQKAGTISIVARGTTTVAGSLKAEGATVGGFIDTSGEHLHVADSARISTLAAHGKAGTWLIDPQDFTIAASGGDITGATLSGELASNNIIIQSIAGATAGNGDIFVNDAVTWSSGKTLTLDAYRNIVFNAPVSVTGAGGLTLIDADHTQTSGTPGTNDGNAADGDLLFNANGSVAFTDVTNGNNTALNINAQAYTLENDITGLKNAITSNASGFYALADNYDASVDGTYTTSPIATSFGGTFEGLGNTISNLTIHDTSDNLAALFAVVVAGTVRDINLANVSVSDTQFSSHAAGLIATFGSGDVTGSSVTGSVTDSANQGIAGGLVAYAGGGTIANSSSSAAVTTGNGWAGGLVGYMGSTAITDSSASGAVVGGTGSNVGGFVGQNLGSISGSFATGAVTGGASGNAGGFVGLNAHAITEDYATGAVLAGGVTVAGGFAGSSSADITQSYSTGAVTGSDGSIVGGFLGQNNGGADAQDYATGAVTAGNSSIAGGFVGENHVGTIDESYSLGKVTAAPGSTIGGFAGINNTGSDISASVADYYNATTNTGAGVGSDDATSNVHGLSFTAMLNSANYSGWTFGTSTSGTDWVIVDLDGSFNNSSSTPTGGTTPMLESEYSTTITNAHQLQLMELDLTASYTLANDIDATATAGGGVWSSNGFVPIGTGLSTGVGEFTGMLNGQNHVVDGLFIDSDPSGTHSELSWVGLFGAMGGTVENLGLSNVNITSNNDEGFVFPGTGALAGWSFGTISNVWSSGSVKATQADDANTEVGGLVGQFETGTISNSRSSATVSDLGTGGSVGGLIGENFASGTVTNSYATGNVSSGDNGDVGGFIGSIFGTATITGSYATGSVTEGNSGWVGGFVGIQANQNSTITRSFALGNVTGEGDASSGGFAGDINGTVSESYAGGNVANIAGSLSNAGDVGGFTGGVDEHGAITQSYSTGSASGDSSAAVGGFAGSNGGNIDESYTLSKVIGGDPTSTGAFVGSNNTAGNIGATVNDYYATDINGSLAGFGENTSSGSVAGLAFLTTTQMRTASNFAGWSSDFGTLGGGAGWVIVDNDGTFNNASGASGGATPMLLGEYSTSIVDAHQLQLMQIDPTATYTLANDIDMSGTGNGLDVWGSQGFIAIGGNSAAGNFTGTFDGAGHTLSNLFIDDTLLGNTNTGLFGIIGAAATVENVTFSDATVKLGIVSHVGVLAGDNEGTIENVTVRGNVTGGDSALAGGLVGTSGGTISGSSFTGTITSLGNSGAVGGLVGYLSGGEVTSSFASATVTGGINGYAGGFVGSVSNGASIHGSYANGNVAADSGTEVGGFVGYDNGSIGTSYATGTATNDGASGFAGGFAGVVDAAGDVEESYSLGEVFGASSVAVGAFAGQDEGTLGASKDDFYSTFSNGSTPAIGSGLTTQPNVIGLNNTQLRSTSNFTDWTFGALGSNADWVIVDADQSLNNASGLGATSPMLLNEYSTTIVNAHQLQLMQLDPTADYTVAADFDAGDTAHSVDVWNSHGFVPVGDFSGSFEGNGHTITGLTISNASVANVGLFSVVDSGATISDVTLANTLIVASGGSLSAGAIAGDDEGTISNVNVSGSVSGAGSDSNVGGVVGFLNGTLSNAHSSATVTATADNGGAGAGGLVGFNNFGTIAQSSASGNVSMNGDLVAAGGLAGVNGGMISQSFATGSVTVTDSASSSGSANDGGGLVGVNDAGTISNSYAMGNVSITGVEQQLGGGFAGANENGGVISDSYSLGTVTAATKGGFVGLEQATIANSYWDTQTSGISSKHGAGSVSNDPGLTGVTTATLEGGLQTGFSGSTWAVVSGLSMPYLKWQFPTGTPQVVSGFMVDGIDGNPLSGQTISLMQNGSNLNSALTDGSVVSYADGSFYFLLAPGAISSNTNAGLLVYDISLHAEVFADRASDSVTDLILTKNFLTEDTSRTKLSALNADFIATDGGVDPQSTPNVKIDASGNFTIDQAMTYTGDTVILDVNGGAVNQIAAITASDLLLEGQANFTLANGANDVATLAMKGDGSLSFLDNHALTIGTVADVNGIDAGGGVTLTTTSGGISITQRMEAESHPLTLNSAAAISESGAGFIEATELSGTSHGKVTLGGKNKVGDLGSFDTGGDNSFLLKNVIDLQVDGFVNAGASDLTLTTTGSGHDIVMGGTLLAETVILHSAASITEPLGVIEASNLVGTAHGDVTLDNASNDVLDIQGFTTGGGDFTFVDDDDLTVSGKLDAGAGDVSLKTLGSGHDMTVNGTVAGKTVTFISAGQLSEGSSGKIDATTLTGSSHSSASLGSTHNVITNLAAFTSGGNFTLFDNHDLNDTGIVNAGSHTLELETVGNGHDISIGSKLKGGTVDLISAATIVEVSGGVIDADSLTGSAVGVADFGSATNTVTDLAAFLATGAFTLVDATDLDVTGDVIGPSINLTTKGSGHDIKIDGELGTPGNLSLISAGTISETGSAVVEAGTVSGSSVGATKLTSKHNLIKNLGTFTSGSALSVTDNTSLKTTGTVNAGSHTVTLKTVSGGVNDITIASKIEGGTVKLTSADDVSESSAGQIDATTLTGSGHNIELTSALNDFAKLGAFKGGFIEITDDANLTTTGAVNAGNGIISLTTVGASHDLQIASTLTGETVNLKVTGAANETSAGAIKATMLNVTAGTGITLTSNKNKITTVGTDKTKTGPNKITK